MTAMAKVTLTSYSMGDATEADYERWISYVCDHIDERVGFEVDVSARPYGEPGDDAVTGRNLLDEDREHVQCMLQGLWEEFCAEGDGEDDDEETAGPDEYRLSFDGDGGEYNETVEAWSTEEAVTKAYQCMLDSTFPPYGSIQDFRVFLGNENVAEGRIVIPPTVRVWRDDEPINPLDVRAYGLDELQDDIEACPGSGTRVVDGVEYRWERVK